MDDTPNNVIPMVRPIGRPLLIPEWLAEVADRGMLDGEARRCGFDGCSVYNSEEVA